jgi:hypothetical protein
LKEARDYFEFYILNVECAFVSRKDAKEKNKAQRKTLCAFAFLASLRETKAHSTFKIQHTK